MYRTYPSGWIKIDVGEEIVVFSVPGKLVVNKFFETHHTLIFRFSVNEQADLYLVCVSVRSLPSRIRYEIEKLKCTRIDEDTLILTIQERETQTQIEFYALRVMDQQRLDNWLNESDSFSV
ncbi:MAG: hypothetical protein R3C11_10075 [Planctomycetaceae bacterium]